MNRTDLRGNCGIDVDECASRPCKNGGTCLQAVQPGSASAYNCICAVGVSGNNCEVDVDECASSPCENGATCKESATNPVVPYDAYSCVCPPGNANGVCLYSFPAQYQSLCNVTHSRQSLRSGNCNVDVNECLSSPCRNQAKCTESATNANISIHAYRCSCKHGYTGGYCSYKYKPIFTEECTVAESTSSRKYTGNCDVLRVDHRSGLAAAPAVLTWSARTLIDIDRASRAIVPRPTRTLIRIDRYPHK
eukprot:COSAG05_NODE_7642_length_785_cov_2.740525_1_plen_248_part_10